MWNMPDLPTLYRRTSPAVVWIGAEVGSEDFHILQQMKSIVGTDIKWQGTGFLVSADGLIATAGHMVRDTESFEVMFSDGTIAKADFVHMECMSRCDVGFIKLRSKHRKKRPYFRFDTKIEIGEGLIILGHPWGLNNGIVLAQGVVSLFNRSESFFGIKLVIQTDAASWPGNSGSPIIDMDGECIGILIGGRYGADSFSIVTPARLVELAMQKAIAEIGLRNAR